MLKWWFWWDWGKPCSNLSLRGSMLGYVGFQQCTCCFLHEETVLAEIQFLEHPFFPAHPVLRSLSFLHLILESVLWYALLLSICPTAMFFWSRACQVQVCCWWFVRRFFRPGVGVAKRGDFPLRESNPGRRLGQGCDQLCVMGREQYRNVGSFH